MTNPAELQRVQPGAEIAAVSTPMTLIQLALQQGASVEVLRDLFKLKQEVEADEARKAYIEAFNLFKAHSSRIVRNITVSDGPLKGKKYADLFTVVDALTADLSKHGLSSSWKLTKDDPQWIEVTCTIRHERGHSEAVSMGGPPDTGGAKNSIQSRASTITYLERYTLLAATGMAAAGTDNDGRGDGAQMPDQQYILHMENIDNAANPDELKRFFTAAYKAAELAKDESAKARFADAKDKRKVELAR